MNPEKYSNINERIARIKSTINDNNFKKINSSIDPYNTDICEPDNVPMAGDLDAIMTYLIYIHRNQIKILDNQKSIIEDIHTLYKKLSNDYAPNTAIGTFPNTIRY